MNKKYIIVFISLFLLSGCTVYYDVDINENFTINESIQFLEKRIVLSKYGSDMTKVMQEIATNYTTNSLIQPNLKININSIVDNTMDTEWATTRIKRNYDSLSDFENSSIFDYYFVTNDIVKENGNYIFYCSGFNMDNVNDLIFNYGYQFDFDGLVFQITLPFKVINNNADYVDESKNLYAWNIDQNNYSYKTIKLEFENEKIVTSYNGSHNALGFIMENTPQAKSNRIWLVISTIFISIVVCVIIITRKIKKVDKL